MTELVITWRPFDREDAALGLKPYRVRISDDWPVVVPRDYGLDITHADRREIIPWHQIELVQWLETT